jgi:predicted tellurium resistance membrane protein TerC
VGILIALVIPFVLRYVLLQNLTMTGWLITGTGVLLFLGSAIGMWYDSRKVKELIEQLQKGQELEEEDEEDEVDEEDEEEEE